MPFQRVNDFDMFYEDEGAGEPVLLLHGAFGTARSQYGPLIEYLAERGYRVIGPDLRGYGRSRPPEREYPRDFYHRDMEDVAALLATLQLGATHVVGLSDGGVVGLLLAIGHPESVRSLVTWAANVDFPVEEVGLYDNLREAGKSLHFINLMRERHGMSKAEARAMLDGYITTSLEITESGYDVGVRDHLSEISSPVLVGAGKLGDFLPLRHAELQDQLIPRSELWLVPHVGHYWPQTEEGREVFANRVLNWLAQNG